MTISDQILLVEDNQDDELLMLRALSKAGISNPVHVARDGAEALEWLFATGRHADRNADEVPVLILLDLNLPRLNGIEVLEAVRRDALTQFVPVVILTTSREESDIAASYQAGVNSFVRKPVDFRAFTDAVNTLSVYWLLMNEGPSRK